MFNGDWFDQHLLDLADRNLKREIAKMSEADRAYIFSPDPNAKPPKSKVLNWLSERKQ